jgi:hypothetical protein
VPYNFSRNWPNLERVFRPQGQFLQPSKLHDRVVLTFDALGRLFTSGAQLRSSRFTLTAAVGTQTQLLTEPEPGFIQYPVRLSYSNADAAARTVQVGIVDTANSPDPWGRWSGTPGLVLDTDSAPAGFSVSLYPVPVPRGNQLLASFFAMSGANSGIVDYLWIDVPGELFMLDDFAI